MTASEFKASLQALQLTPEAFARVFCVNESNAQRWLSGQFAIPYSIAKLLVLVRDGRLKLSDVCPHWRVDKYGVCQDCGIDMLTAEPDPTMLHMRKR